MPPPTPHPDPGGPVPTGDVRASGHGGAPRRSRHAPDVPARYRRADTGIAGCGPAEPVADHRLTTDEATETAVDLVTCPREASTL